MNPVSVPKRIKRPVVKRQEPQPEQEEPQPQPQQEEKEDCSEEHKEEHVQEDTSISPMNHVIEKLGQIQHPNIYLLCDSTVIQWLYGDTSFLPEMPLPSTKKVSNCMMTQWYKKQEDEWGQGVMRRRRPDLTLDKQWTNRFGEYLCEEMLLLQGTTPFKPQKRNHYQPDVETETTVWEAKAQTYYTTGTAGEKILGTPFKYADVPVLYSKPLKILCMGGAEKLSREKYGNLVGPCQTPQKKQMLDVFRSLNIEYIGYTDMLNEWATKSE